MNAIEQNVNFLLQIKGNIKYDLGLFIAFKNASQPSLEWYKDGEKCKAETMQCLSGPKTEDNQ